MAERYDCKSYSAWCNAPIIFHEILCIITMQRIQWNHQRRLSSADALWASEAQKRQPEGALKECLKK
jgi:hypothetical protein